MINVPSLAAASGSGQQSVVEFLVELDETDLDQLGPDGVSPLCAAATWGYAPIVRLLVDATCDVNLRNTDQLGSTALHVAACQEHEEVVELLLRAGADTMLEDAEGRTPCDFASVSDGIWPLFEARGLSRTPKQELLRKRLIRRLGAEEEKEASDKDGGTVAAYTRPGSAYVRSDRQSSWRPPSPSRDAHLPTVREALNEFSPMRKAVPPVPFDSLILDKRAKVTHTVDRLILEHPEEPGLQSEGQYGTAEPSSPTDFPDEISVASGAGRAAAAFLRAERLAMEASASSEPLD